MEKKDLINRKKAIVTMANERKAAYFLGKEVAGALTTSHKKPEDIEIDGVAHWVMEGLEERVSPEVLDVLYMLLEGFDDDTQLWIAESFLDFTLEHDVHIMWSLPLNAALKTGYMLIAADRDIKESDINKIYDYSQGV